MADPRTLPRTQQRIWKALRVMRRDIDIPFLAMTAAAPESSTGDYVRLLVRAGYVAIEHEGGRRIGNISRYRLARDSGPQAPVRAITVMFDPNDGATYALPLRRTARPAASRTPVWIEPLGEAA